MKQTLRLALALGLLATSPVLAADSVTPGLWERAWSSTKNGTARAWQSTKNGSVRVWDSTKRVGKQTADLATSPFRKGKKTPNEPKTVWRQFGASMTLDPAAVKLPECRSIRATIVLVNKGKTPAQFEFPNTQRIEVLVKNEAGKVFSRWSDDQKLDKEQGFLVINPEERLEYTATISTRDMTPGQTYIIEAYFPSFDQIRTSRIVVPTK